MFTKKELQIILGCVGARIGAYWENSKRNKEAKKLEKLYDKIVNKLNSKAV